MYQEYKQFIKDDLFFRPFGDHGIGHTRRVLYLALKLAAAYSLSENEKKLLAIACCYHDIGRWHDLTADEHGMESSKKFLKLELDKKHNVSGANLETVLKLIVFHSLPDEQFIGSDRERLMYQILKDADALDRLRFNDLDPKYLRLSESKTLIDKAKQLIDQITAAHS